MSEAEQVAAALAARQAERARKAAEDHARNARATLVKRQRADRERMHRLIPFEERLIFYRTPGLGAMYCRAVPSNLQADNAPRPESFGEFAEVLGYGRTIEGQVSRVFFNLIDDRLIPDGFDEFVPDDFNSEAVDPLSIAARRPMSPPVLLESTAAAIVEERTHIAKRVEVWRWHKETRERAAAREEAEKLKAELEAAAAAIVQPLPPKPKPKRWWEVFR